jgi:hypothetical protein
MRDNNQEFFQALRKIGYEEPMANECVQVTQMIYLAQAPSLSWLQNKYNNRLYFVVFHPRKRLPQDVLGVSGAPI